MDMRRFGDLVAWRSVDVVFHGDGLAAPFSHAKPGAVGNGSQTRIDNK